MINLKIITIDGIFFSGEVSEIILPTDTGQITILPHHIPMIAKLKEGTVLLKMTNENNSTEKTVPISGGVVEVRPQSEVYILVM